MADKITETRTLNIGVEYVRATGDKAGTKKTTYFKLTNPKENLTEQEIKNATESLLTPQSGNVNPFWTDPDTGEAMSDAKIFTAYTEYERKLDIEIS